MGDLSAVLSAISTVGFPIICCIAMGWYVKYATDKNREEVAVLNREHKAEIAEVTKAISNNTIVMQQLVDTIELKWGGSDGKSHVSDRDS